MKHDDTLPGLTLWLKEALLREGFGTISLYADEVENEDLWNQVVAKLNGMRIYTVENLAESMITVTQNRSEQAIQELNSQVRELEARFQYAQQQLSFYKMQAAVNEKKADAYDAFLGQLGGLEVT